MKQLYKCDNCDAVHTRRQLKDVGELDSDFLVPGAIIGTGRCRTCDAMCYPLVLDLASRKVLKAVCDVWDALCDILAENGDDASCFELPDTLHKNAVKATERLHAALSPQLLDVITVEPKGGESK